MVWLTRLTKLKVDTDGSWGYSDMMPPFRGTEKICTGVDSQPVIIAASCAEVKRKTAVLASLRERPPSQPSNPPQTAHSPVRASSILDNQADQRQTFPDVRPSYTVLKEPSILMLLLIIIIGVPIGICLLPIVLIHRLIFFRPILDLPEQRG